MKAHYKTADGRIVFEINGDSAKLVFEQIASVQELFEAETACGVCHSSEGKGIRFVVRSVEKDGKRYKYFELRCLQCFSRFSFGQNQEGGGLFPKRKHADGSAIGNRGWEKYERKPKPGDAPASEPRPNEQTAQRRENPTPMGEHYDYAPGVTDDDVPF